MPKTKRKTRKSKKVTKPEEELTRKEKYHKYLHSPEWIAKRDKIKEERKCCEICGETEKLQVHHLNYDNVGNEKDEDLMLLCEYHHKVLHKKKIVIIDASGVEFQKSKLSDAILDSLEDLGYYEVFFKKDKVFVSKGYVESVVKADGTEIRFNPETWLFMSQCLDVE